MNVCYRSILLVGVLYLLSTDAIAEEKTPPERPWYRQSLVGMEVGPTGANFGRIADPTDLRACAKFDGREIVRRCAAANCQYVVLWARDGDWAYYNSKLLPKAPGLRDRDPLRDAVDEARQQKIPLIAYCVVQQGGQFLEAHPEFLARGVDGKPLGIFCFNSGYLDWMKRILAEQLAYGVDGFHIDMLTQSFDPPYGCWCDTCRRQFQAQYGRPMPKGATWDEDWDRMLEFRYRSSQRFEQALYQYVKSVNPRASVDFNYHGNPPFSFEVGHRPVQHAGNADFVTGETGSWLGGPVTYGLTAEFYRAATPSRPYQVAMQRGLKMYHDQTTRPLNDIRWELFALLSHGAFVTMVDKLAYDGGADPVGYERVGAAFAEVRRKAEHFGQTPVYDVGLYFSSRSRDWIGREQSDEWYKSFRGAHKACVYEHLLFGVVLDENVSAATLRQFPVVCLPNVGILSEKEVQLLRQYVQDGGKLIVTGQSGLFDRLGQPLHDTTRRRVKAEWRALCVIGELIGAEPVRRLDTLDNWVSFSASDSTDAGRGLAGQIRPDWPFLVHGPATVYHPTTAATIGQLLAPVRATRDNAGFWPLSAGARVGPAILVNRVGRGTVLTFACSPDGATATSWPVAEARQLFANAVRYLHPKRRLRIDAPQSVETVVSDDPATRTLRVHLIACQAPPQTQTVNRMRPYALPAMIEDTPLYRVSIESLDPLKAAHALSAATAIKLTNRHVEATVNDIHEVLLLNY